MIHLAYVSSATHLMTQTELLELLAQARDINKELGVTGMLLYKDGSFLQVLEGEEEAVHDVYRRICNDPRHDRVHVLFDEPIENRDFPDWSMGFQNLDSREAQGVKGYRPFFDDDMAAREMFKDRTRAKKLLLLFRAKS